MGKNKGTSYIVLLLKRNGGNVMQVLANLSSPKEKTFHLINKASAKTNNAQSISIKDIEGVLGFNKCKPISLTPSDEKVKNEEGDYFRDWYEEELRRIYEE